MMGRFKKVITVLILIVCLFFLSLVFWIQVNGKSAIERRASLMLQRPVTVDKVQLRFPLILSLTGFNIEGLLWADKAEVNCDPLIFLGKKFRLSHVGLVNPILTLHRTSDQQIIWAEHYAEPAIVPLSSPPAKSRPIKAVINVLTVTNGQIHFPNHSSGDDAFEFSLSHVDLAAKNVPLSGQATDVAFDFWGKIEGEGIPFAGDSLKGSGWINWPGRNMDTTFGVVNPQGKIDVEVNLNAKANDMMVRGHLKTRRMGLKAPEANENSMERLLLDAIQSAGMEVNLDFSFPTKMDQWELRNIEFSGNLNASDKGKTQAEKMEDLKNIGQQFKAVGEQLYEKYNKEETK
jgi:hypothetical protein